MRVLIVAAICAGALCGQGMVCRRTSLPPATVRAEGITELTSDVLLSCTGGTRLSANSPLPEYQILLIGSVPFANRTLAPDEAQPALPATLNWNDALLILDDAPARSQVPCAPLTDSAGCPAAAGSSANPNVFQGRSLQDNVIVFRRVPLESPGDGKTKLIRISNLRINASLLPTDPETPEAKVTVQLFDAKGNQLVQDSGQSVALAKPGYTFSVRSIDDGPADPKAPALTVTPTMLPFSSPGRSVAFNVKFTEGSANAFKRRNVGTSGVDPNFLASQAEPGAFTNTESGLFNGSFPAVNNLNTVGLADSGTRLMVTFTDIPASVSLLVSVRDTPSGTTGYSDQLARAILTSTDSRGSGPFFQPLTAYLPPGSSYGFSMAPVDAGRVTLAWEIVAADPDKIESFSFEIRLISLSGGTPRLGTALALGRLGPLYSDSAAPSTRSEPSFRETLADPLPAFRLVSTLSVSNLVSVSAASFSGGAVAPDSLVTAFGSNLSTTTEISGAAPAARLAGVTVDVIDSVGSRKSVPLLMVSPNQINFLLDPATRPGQAVVTVNSSGRNVATGYLSVEAIAPSLFSANGDGRGIPAGVILHAKNGQSALLARYDSQQSLWLPEPVDVSGGDVYISLYGTGIRGRSVQSPVSLSVGGQSVPVTYAGAQGQYAGLDQVNAGPLPPSLSGRGAVTLLLTVDGKVANALTIQIR